MLDGKRKLREVRKCKAMKRKCVFALLLYHKDDLVEGQLQKLSFLNNNNDSSSEDQVQHRGSSTKFFLEL
jgi:hypothetical protein